MYTDHSPLKIHPCTKRWFSSLKPVSEFSTGDFVLSLSRSPDGVLSNTAFKGLQLGGEI